MNRGSKVGLDTNVLIYALNRDSRFHDRARGLLEQVAEGEFLGVVSWQNLMEFYAIVTDVRRFTKALTSTKAILEVQRLLDVGLEVVGTNLKTKKIVLDTLKDSKPKGQLVHDTFLACTLLSNGIELLVTENKKDFAGIVGLEVVELAEFESLGS